MRAFTIYNEHGEVLQTGICQDHMVGLQACEGAFILEGAMADETQYVDTLLGKLVEKPALGAALKGGRIRANGLAEAVISGLPDPTRVTVEPGGWVYTVTDGAFEFSTEAPGTYTIECVARNKLPAVFTVEAT